MASKTIGKSLLFGFAGNYSRQPDSVIESHVVKGDKSVYFGDPVMLDDEGFVQAVDDTFTADGFVGIATAEIRSAVTVDNMDGVYRTDNIAPIMTRGAVSVICQTGTPAKGGKVFVRIANAPTGKKIGGLEAAADGVNTVELSSCVWVSGVDANQVAEIRLKNINLV